MKVLGEQIHSWKISTGTTIGVRKFQMKELYEAARTFDDPILHIGSKASVLDKGYRWRKMFDGKKMIGVDLEEGDNVDAVYDITKNISKLRKLTGIKQFKTIICPHILEHVQNPFVASDNITKLLATGGRLFVTVPWVQGFHEFPDDYWRISFSGLKQLFPTFDWEYEYYSNAREDEGYQLTLDGIVEHSVRTCRIERNLFQFQIPSPPKQNMFDDRKGEKITLSKQFMPGLIVNMIGIKK